MLSLLLRLAELVAAVLKQGGLIDPTSNPGAATPQGLHELYKNRAAMTANPYLLRQQACTRQLTTSSIVSQKHYTPPSIDSERRLKTIVSYNQENIRNAFSEASAQQPYTRVSQSPFLAHVPSRSIHYACSSSGTGSWNAPTTSQPLSRNNALRVLNAGDISIHTDRAFPMGITLNSLDFRIVR